MSVSRGPLPRAQVCCLSCRLSRLVLLLRKWGPGRNPAVWTDSCSMGSDTSFPTTSLCPGTLLQGPRHSCLVTPTAGRCPAHGERVWVLAGWSRHLFLLARHYLPASSDLGEVGLRRQRILAPDSATGHFWPATPADIFMQHRGGSE